MPATFDCAVSVIHRDGKFLISQRKKDDHFGGYWEFPGGSQNADETLEACAVREAEEEVGLKVVSQKFLLTVRDPYKDKRINLHFFLCTTNSDVPRPIDCQACRWVSPHELSQILFPPANEQVISLLLKTFA